MTIPEKYKVESIPKEQTYEWLKYKHYAHRIPNIIYSFGLFENKILIGVCTLGMPPNYIEMKAWEPFRANYFNFYLTF